MNYINEKYDTSDLFYFIGRKYVRLEEPTAERISNAIVFPYEDGVSQIEKETPINQSVKVSDKTVIYLGYMSTAHYGNILFDFISRLWWQAENKQNFDWIYTAPNRVHTPALLHQLAELFLGKDVNLVRVTNPTQYKEIIVPQQTFIHDQYIMPQYASIYSKIYLALQPKNTIAYDKIYLTRTHLNRHKEIGEKRFERFFEANGYHVIAPEELAIADQAYLINHCIEMASIEGSHAHGVVWANPRGGGGRQIILRKQSEVIPRQIMLNQLWEKELVLIDVFDEPFRNFPISHDRGPFLLRWTPQIEQFAKDNNMMVPSECRRGYWTDLIEYTIKCIIYKIWHILKHTFR